MKLPVVIGCLFLAGCGATLNMPAPIAYPGACPPDDVKCQRNADAQTLSYIGEREAAVKLMCMDSEVAPYIQSCGIPALY